MKTGHGRAWVWILGMGYYMVVFAGLGVLRHRVGNAGYQSLNALAILAGFPWVGYLMRKFEVPSLF